ncbi:lipid phosphate phosphatase epsilon 1, chloroplastic-like [Olea europaea subsp. europaea]|uniref:Lipid phosphate phosphatase epsilon 1, chloroplastic-like n=1 Tax=Olea europaea subsp. europaea TaxID=158383 RepID=A0A8S0T9Y3_OLEEU|nr:lipid phosphate phosphatase epsilon 1, chloroplastic-like [Olea europaea subsp. europaea]
MLLTSATVIRPTATALTSQSRAFHKPITIFTTKLAFNSQKWVCTGQSQNSRVGSIRNADTSSTEEDVESFEQENFINRASNFETGGIEATLNNLSKWLVAVLFMTLIWRHDPGTLWAVIGVSLNGILAIALKMILNQARPISTLKADPGMPSSHAQFMFYAVAFINLSILEFYGINALSTTLCGLVFIVGSYFSWLRISQQFHTISQVVVGAVLGSIFSIFWYWSWNAFVLKSFTSYLWVRVLIVLCSTGFCIKFLVYVFQSWILPDE